MPVDVTYSKARSSLASLWDEAVDNREEIIMHRRGKESVSLIPTAELRSLQETLHLLRSPRNAARLLAAIRRSEEGLVEAQTIDELRKEVGLGQKG
jgi:antitoxin YefM